MPWKPLVKHATSVLPVTLRASFSAASTAIVPAWSGELHLVIQVPGPEDQLVERGESPASATVYMSRE